MKLNCPNLLKPLWTINHQNSQFYYRTEPFSFHHFTMRHPSLCKKLHSLIIFKLRLIGSYRDSFKLLTKLQCCNFGATKNFRIWKNWNSGNHVMTDHKLLFLSSHYFTNPDFFFLEINFENANLIVIFKVENNLKGSLNWSHHLHLWWKFKL